MLQLLDMRKMLTEVLLTVTSEEMEDVAREVYAKERAKASKGITSGRKLPTVPHSVAMPKRYNKMLLY